MITLIRISLNFLPDEIAAYLKLVPPKLAPLILQISGCLYFAFAMLNWLAKANLIGGIYIRPVAVANLTHFLVGGLTLNQSRFVNLDILFV